LKMLDLNLNSIELLVRNDVVLFISFDVLKPIKNFCTYL